MRGDFSRIVESNCFYLIEVEFYMSDSIESVKPRIDNLEFQSILAFCLAEQFFRAETKISTVAKIFDRDRSYQGCDWNKKWVWKLPWQWNDDPLESIVESWGFEVSVEFSANIASETQLFLKILPYFDDFEIDKIELAILPVRVHLLKFAQLQQLFNDYDDDEATGIYLYGYGIIPNELTEYQKDSEVPEFWKVDLWQMLHQFSTEIRDRCS